MTKINPNKHIVDCEQEFEFALENALHRYISDNYEALLNKAPEHLSILESAAKNEVCIIASFDTKGMVFELFKEEQFTLVPALIDLPSLKEFFIEFTFETKVLLCNVYFDDSNKVHTVILGDYDNRIYHIFDTSSPAVDGDTSLFNWFYEVLFSVNHLNFEQRFAEALAELLSFQEIIDNEQQLMEEKFDAYGIDKVDLHQDFKTSDVTVVFKNGYVLDTSYENLRKSLGLTANNANSEN